MTDKSAADAGSTQELFVRPARGDAKAMLAQMDALVEPVEAPTPVVEPAPKPVVAPPPTARPARMRRRHWGLISSFLVFVSVPIFASGWYLWERAVDQYGSVAAFTVSQEEGQRASDLLGGLTALAGGSSAGDSDILFEFIQSQTLIQRVEANLEIREHYSAHWDQDPVFGLDPEATFEDLESYWGRIVRISHDQRSGLLELQVRAFSPEMARDVAQQVIVESQSMINNLNALAREDALRFAQNDLDEAIARLSEARGALTSFRLRSQILDPEADIQGRMGVLSNLQQQLAQALVDFDLLTQTTSPNDPRIVQEQQRIDVIRTRLESERVAIVEGDRGDATEQDYPSLMSEFEGLTVEREFAEQNYRAALAAVDLARDDVARQSRYLATFIEPVMAESPQYPQRELLLGVISLFVFLSWAVGCLIYYSIRDRG